MKLPIFNNHTVKGLFGSDFGIPPHYAWISHVIQGILYHKYPIILPVFITYQCIQIIMKREIWEDFVDMVEFYIGYILGFYILNQK